ncbi:MAG: Rpn family recombination-promoting nuclease/putative transposase, partial [Okeania sp. SIO2H7]|nr:Rpn family recombination-promoting nuclease/putative transposase [Okeania sp. SIO2H7]
MKTDSIFYNIFQAFPNIFFELINRPGQTANNYKFSSVEIKQLAFRIDGLFLPNSPDLPIYFREVQFQPDEELYERFFAEIFLYLKQTELTNNWRGAIIYPRRSVDIGDTSRYVELFDSGRVDRIYLDELGKPSEQSIGIATIQLIVANKNKAFEQTRELIERVPEEIEGRRQQQQLLQLIETILIYKLPEASREEIEAMFGLSDLKQTRFYQEAKEEGIQEGEQLGEQRGKLASVPLLLNLVATVEQIATALGLDGDLVRQVARQQ